MAAYLPCVMVKDIPAIEMRADLDFLVSFLATL